MAVVTYEAVEPTPIANALVQKCYQDGVHKSYFITPNEGYVLHDNAYDFEDMDGNQFLGYRTTTATCGANYDFAVNSREFYAVLETDVPADQIFNNPGGAEIM